MKVYSCCVWPWSGFLCISMFSLPSEKFVEKVFEEITCQCVGVQRDRDTTTSLSYCKNGMVDKHGLKKKGIPQ